jgi:general transcription factor 3C polypeptide 3 (transcription factor C subunit 4)
MGTEDVMKVDVVEEENEGEQEEEVEEEGEEGEEEDECEYTFRFEEGINPLDFVEDNAASGVQPYEQFERLEYEALAEKKRKLLADCQR